MNAKNGEKSKLIYYLLSLLLALFGYLGRDLYATVKDMTSKVTDTEKRVTRLEDNYANLEKMNDSIDKKLDRLLRR